MKKLVPEIAALLGILGATVIDMHAEPHDYETNVLKRPPGRGGEGEPLSPTRPARAPPPPPRGPENRFARA